jgi:hypothetical protein
MKFVFACRAVTYDQIARRHFPKTNEIVVRRRIRRLADAGYLKIGVIDLAGKVVRVVQPLPAMWPVISEKWQFAVDTPHFKSESPEHDVRMAEVFMRLEKLTSYRSFFTENLLQSSTALAEDPRFKDAARIQSDGALTVVDAKGVSKIYAVELELSKKTPDRYRQKFIDYYLAHSLDGVLYVSPEREVVSLVARIDQEISRDRDSIVHFAFESSVLSANPKIIFSNREEQKIELA